MALTAIQVSAEAQKALTSIRELESYFSNYLTVSTFGGDYMYQRIHKLHTVCDAIVADSGAATPNLTDVKNVQVTAGETTIDELIKYQRDFLTVQTFFGDYGLQRLNKIKTALDNIKAGV